MYIEIRMREGVAECDLIRTLQPRVSKEIIHRNSIHMKPLILSSSFPLMQYA